MDYARFEELQRLKRAAYNLWRNDFISQIKYEDILQKISLEEEQMREAEQEN